MCWSFGASVTMVAAGAAVTTYAARKGVTPAIWVTLGYFTLMEALQVAGYMVVDACNSPANRTVALLSYLHIVFQPFFVNAFAMQLVPEAVRLRISRWVYGVCSLSAVFMLAQLFPFDWAGTCRVGQALCANRLCVISGEWHIGWDIPYNGLANFADHLVGMYVGFPSYIIAVFIVPILYGSWRFTIFHILVGPWLADRLTSNVNEAPAVWCLFSIGILLFAVFPKLLDHISVRRWWIWPTSWQRVSG